MSQMCLVAVENARRYGWHDILDALREKADEYGLGLVLEPSRESYGNVMSHFDPAQSALFCISDQKGGTTCEDLFCPDWCNVDEKRPRTFVENLHILQEILSLIPPPAGPIHLFLGTDLGLYGDYPIMPCQVEDLPDVVESVANRDGYVSEMHVVIGEMSK